MKLTVRNFRKLHPYSWALVYSIISSAILVAAYSLVSGHRLSWAFLVPVSVWVAGCLIGVWRDSKQVGKTSPYAKSSSSFRTWRTRLSAERHTPPKILRIAATVYVVLFLLAASSIVAGIASATASVRSLATIVAGTFGLSAVGLGILLALDYKGSAQAAERWNGAFLSGPITFSGHSSSVQGFRRFGIMLLAFGIALVGFSWSGVIRWRT